MNITELPEEMLIEIFSYLVLSVYKRVCKVFSSIDMSDHTLFTIMQRYPSIRSIDNDDVSLYMICNRHICEVDTIIEHIDKYIYHDNYVLANIIADRHPKVRHYSQSAYEYLRRYVLNDEYQYVYNMLRIFGNIKYRETDMIYRKHQLMWLRNNVRHF